MLKKSPPKPKPAPLTEAELRFRAEAARRNLRETIESVAIAFILAFLFRTFEAEAFVIPTGSMAPTLQGQHKDVECYMCGFRYRINASQADDDGNQGKNTDVVAGTCPQCRYTMALDAKAGELADRSAAEVKYGLEQDTYPGDRILVGKFVYDLQEPKRWDVVVFKFPGDTKMNYIKRLVGEPGDELLISHGDIYVRPVGTQQDPEIARKDPGKLRAMMQLVHDSAWTCTELYRNGWPDRWQPLPAPAKGETGNWETSTPTESELKSKHFQPTYSVAAGQAETRWLRYQHFVPGWNDWRAMAQGPLGGNYPFRPQLITDFYAYNAGISRKELFPGDSIAPDPRRLGLNWVGDLMLEADVEVQNDQGELQLELVEGGVHFLCQIDVATGQAKLSSSDPALKDFQPQASTALRGPGSYSLRFANADDKLYLWVDDEVIEFDSPTTYDLEIDRPESDGADPGDLAPAGIGSRGVGLQVSALRLWRDIYYIADSWDDKNPTGMVVDYPGDVLGHDFPHHTEDFIDLLSSPAQWEIFTKRRTVSFTMEANPADPGRDQYFMLGDNSPFSKDSRLWPEGEHDLKHYVERQLLIGKALCIYWPHTWHRLPGVHIPFPYFPNFGDMGLVR